MGNYKLVTRTCACPCRRQWRTLESSADIYYSMYECAAHVPNAGRLEFGGFTDYTVKKERSKERRARAKSRWDKD